MKREIDDDIAYPWFCFYSLFKTKQDIFLLRQTAGVNISFGVNNPFQLPIR